MGGVSSDGFVVPSPAASTRSSSAANPEGSGRNALTAETPDT